tara:strand:- start:3079 stop:3633 length:555 start_codon:yes stop_codon:yes gene_type:complete
MNCSNCGNTISEDTKFCGKCGQKLDTATKAVSQSESGEKKSWVGGAVTVIVFILAFVAFRYLTQEAISPSPNLSNQNSTERAELITDTVQEIKSTTALPARLDEVTMWNDVTAQPNAIRYHYTLNDVDTSSLSNSYFKNYLGPTLCSNQDTRYILDQGIGMEYSYAVQGSSQSYFISFTNADCL